jgi:hypothetical protein
MMMAGIEALRDPSGSISLASSYEDPGWEIDALRRIPGLLD